MTTIVLVISLIALAAPAHAAQKTRTGVDDAVPMEKRCRDLVGKEQPEGEGRGHVGHLQVQRFSDCMMGVPN